jgi:hypothetical protein
MQGYLHIVFPVPNLDAGAAGAAGAAGIQI